MLSVVTKLPFKSIKVSDSGKREWASASTPESLIRVLADEQPFQSAQIGRLRQGSQAGVADGVLPKIERFNRFDQRRFRQKPGADRADAIRAEVQNRRTAQHSLEQFGVGKRFHAGIADLVVVKRQRVELLQRIAVDQHRSADSLRLLPLRSRWRSDPR